MPRPLLVLVRWHGDIIAAHTVEEGTAGTRPDLAASYACDGVSVEAFDVSAERASLPLGADFELRGPLAYLASAALHLVLAAVVLLSLRGRSHAQLEADDANRRASTIQDYLTRIAANDTGSEPPETVPRHASVAEESAPDPSAPTTAPGSGGADAITASNAVCAPTHVSSSGPTCTRTVTVTSLSVPPGCWTDTVIKVGQTGTLSFPCAGDGDATLSFGSKAFAGADVGGKVDVCTGTEFPWSDGCAWTSAQHVSGSIASGTLSFGYGEAPKPGQNRQCAPSCSASGAVRVEDAAAKPADGRRAEK